MQNRRKSILSSARLLAVAVTALVVSTAWAVDLDRKVDLTIAAQPLSSALMDFSRQAQVQVMSPDTALGQRQAMALNGRYSIRDALGTLLKGTEFAYSSAGPNTIAIMQSAGKGAQTGAVVSTVRDDLKLAQTDQSHEAGDSVENKVEPKLEEIVVTAQKRKERLLDVPIAIRAISGDDLDAARIRDISDLALAVPGLAVQKTAPGQMQIAIRGIAADRGDAAVTGIYLDEVPLTASVGEGLGNADLGTQDLQRVEVLKGPQGTLFGDGSVGGTVRYITKDPALDKAEGSLKSSYYVTHGGDPSWDVRGVASIPVVDGVFAVRVVGSYEDGGGWIDKVAGPGQPVLEKNINDSKSHDFRIKALLKASDDLSITGLISTGRFNGRGNNINVAPFDNSQYQPAIDPNRDEPNSYKYNIYNLTATYALGFANLMSSTSQYTTDRSNSVSQIALAAPAPGTLFQIALDGKLVKVNAFSQEVRLTSSSNGPFKWTGGLFYKDAKARFDPDASDGRFQLAIGSFLLPPTFGPSADQTSKTKAAFGDISYDLTSRLEIGGGVRYVEDDRAGTFGQKMYDKLTYRAFVSYKVADDVSVYANTSTGFRAGVFNNSVAVGTLGAPLLTQPENVVAYEVGAKARFFDGRLYSSLSLFRSEHQDILGLVLTIDQATGNGSSFYYNIGTARIDGVEWDIQWSPMHNWTLGFAGDVLDSRYTELNPNAQPLQKVGDPANFSPKNGVSLFTQLGIDIASDVRGAFRLDWNRRGHSRDTERNFIWLADIVKSPVVNLVNARFDVDWHDWTYGIFAQNILDDRGTLNASTANLQWQSRPRSVGVTVSRRF